MSGVYLVNRLTLSHLWLACCKVGLWFLPGNQSNVIEAVLQVMLWMRSASRNGMAWQKVTGRVVV